MIRVTRPPLRWQPWAIGVVALVATIAVGVSRLNAGARFGRRVATPTPVPLPTAPAGWQTYPESYGFSFQYPADWTVDDSELQQFATLHAAFTQYSNLVMVSPTTPDVSLTITVASLADEESLLKTSFTSSTSWLAASSSGLPASATTTPVTIAGTAAVRVTGLKVTQGEYETIYYLNLGAASTVRFDCDYTDPAQLQTMEEIAGSFRF
jgi:hypothetical protein